MKTDRHTLVETVRSTCPTPYRLDLAFGRCRIAVTVSTEALRASLLAYYGSFATDPGPAEMEVSVHEAAPPAIDGTFVKKEPEPGKTRIKEEYIDLVDGRIVRKRLTGMVFIFGGGDHIAVGPCLDNLNQVVNFINNRHIQWELCRESLLGHAAAVCRDGRGLAMAGFSGAGKSTLALHVLGAARADFISNDRLMVRRNESCLGMVGVAKLPRINPGTILHNPHLAPILTREERRRFSALPKDELRQLEHKFDASIDDLFGPGRFRLSAPMDGLVILNWQHRADPLRIRRFDASERHDLLQAFMKNTGLFFVPERDCRMPEPSADAYAEYLQHATLWEFSGGVDFEGATRACCRFLDEGTMDDA